MTSTATDPVTIPTAGGYRIDPSSTAVSFTTRHMFGLAPVRGTFRLRDGHIQVTDPVAESSVRATIAAESFHTGTSARDTHVVSATYLDAERHPNIVFASTGIARVDGDWVLRGSLTVRGVTCPLDLRVTQVREDRSGLRLRATARVDRYAFGITAMRGMAGRRLTMTLDVAANRK
ncbi:MAG: YceI family protein [Actinophytocola sp.]|uniref:YceI family protein n=1 Tax=Actinophytocola sp. TaxID=1872138 RepID=UPI0013229F6C|nr:YceI family protein [Actinophytocola sp.]MPZ86266.1 YceI family protein [Actinophytocola sp.]